MKVNSGDEIVETNGRIVSVDGQTMIEWPKDATELRVRAKEDLEDSYKTSQPAMLKLLNDYLSTHK